MQAKLLLTAAITLMLLTVSVAHAEEKKPTVAVALYDGPGAGGDGPKMLEEKFHADTEFRITRIKAEEIRAGKLKNFKVLIVPGGTGSNEGNALGEDGREQVRKFVNEGGVYVGICAGCFLASCQYKWSLHILPVTVVDTPNWERGRGVLKLELTGDGKEWTGRKEADVKSIYHNGPVLKMMPDAKEKVIPLAVYREEMTRKGAKEGLMAGTPAMAAARYGKGWAIGVSPHPEQTADVKDLVPNVIRKALTDAIMR